MTLDDFLGFPEDAGIDEKIAGQERELAAVRQAERILEHAALETIELPIFAEGLPELLAKTLEDVSADAENRVAAQVAAHRMGANGERWLSEGLGYVHDDNCPFCGQGIEGVALLDAYKSFFSAAYHTLREEIASVATTLENSFADRVIGNLARALDRNAAYAEFWREFCVFDAPSLPAGVDISAALTGMREAALVLLRRKAAAPLDSVAANEVFERAGRASASAVDAMTAYNAAVEAGNAAIAARKEQVGAADIQAVQRALSRLIAQRTRHEPNVTQACDAYQDRQREKTDLENEKTQTREQLDAHTEQLIDRYGRSINSYLERINAGFSITTPDYHYRGGVPASTYRVVINETLVDLGDARTPLDQPSFKNTLSSGDRSTLALAFFFAILEQDPRRADKIVVFDDPFTSQDNFRRNHTAFQIRKCGEACAQVIVLSHDPFFLKLVWDKLSAADRKTLQLGRIDEANTAIAEWDIEKATQAQYRADVEVLQRYFTLAQGERRDVIQKIRPMLEAYCRNLYPTQFADQDSLGIMIGKIRAAGAGHPLAPIADALDEINGYCRRYHHAENPNAANEPIDDAELNTYVKRSLRLAGFF